MDGNRSRRFRAAVVIAALASSIAVALAAGPELSATFKVSGVQVSGESVHMTFSFSLRAGQPSDLTVEAVKLGNPAASDHPYASFAGGTIPAGGAFKASQSITVPKSAYKKWKAGEPAALFVRTPGDNGPVWTRVDAMAAGPIE